MSILALVVVNVVLAVLLLGVLAAVMSVPFVARPKAKVTHVRSRERHLRRVA